MTFPGVSAGKESAFNAGDMGLIPGLGRSTGEGKGYPLQCSGLQNPTDCIVHRVAKSWTWLSDFHFTWLAPKQVLHTIVYWLKFFLCFNLIQSKPRYLFYCSKNTYYANKFGKLSSGHRTRKIQFSFQSQRKAMPKNVQTTEELNLSHMLAE